MGVPVAKVTPLPPVSSEKYCQVCLYFINNLVTDDKNLEHRFKCISPFLTANRITSTNILSAVQNSRLLTKILIIRSTSKFDIKKGVSFRSSLFLTIYLSLYGNPPILYCTLLYIPLIYHKYSPFANQNLYFTCINSSGIIPQSCGIFYNKCTPFRGCTNIFPFFSCFYEPSPVLRYVLCVHISYRNQVQIPMP